MKHSSKKYLPQISRFLPPFSANMLTGCLIAQNRAEVTNVLLAFWHNLYFLPSECRASFPDFRAAVALWDQSSTVRNDEGDYRGKSGMIRIRRTCRYSCSSRDIVPRDPIALNTGDHFQGFGVGAHPFQIWRPVIMAMGVMGGLIRENQLLNWFW